MSSLTDSSTALAQILGIIFLVGGLAALFSRKSMSAAIDGVIESHALSWIWGFINLLLGATIVAFHSAWSSDWRIVVTVAGWGGILKGALFMLFPNSARALYRKCNRPGILMTGGIVAILLGLFLLYAGRRI
jgi:hypothetical protein